MPFGDAAMPKLCANAAPSKKAENKNCRIAIALAAHEKLPARAPAGKSKGKAGKHHAGKIP